MNLIQEADPTPEEIIRAAKEQYNLKTLVTLFSGGKDSLTAGHVAKPIADKLGLEFRVLYCHTGINVKENFEYVLKTCNQLGWNLTVEHVAPRFSYEEIVRRYGFPNQGIHSGVMRWLKWFSIRRYLRSHLDDNIAFISGRRKKESKRRMSLKQAIQLNVKGERKDAPILTVGPLFWWSTPQVWDYIHTNNLQVCPVYETLHISGDCLCGCFAESGEAELLSIFHPETAAQIASLERKYGGKWGLGSSMCGALNQDTLDGFKPRTMPIAVFEQEGDLTEEEIEEFAVIDSQENLEGSPEDVVCAECFIDRQKGKAK